MIETGVYEGKPVFISGTEKGIDILDENMSIISSIPYEMEGVEQIESIISPPGNNGLLALKDSETGKWGYVSIEGKLMIDYSYQVAQIFTVDGIAIVKAENGLYGAIDEKGEYVIEPQYNCMTNFSNGRSFAQISKGGEGILIDLEGNKLSDNKFCFSSFPDVVDIYIDGLACVQDYNTKLYGYIDDYGDYVIEPQFIKANDFVNGYATVTGSNGLRGIINDKGEEVVPCQYEDMTFLSEDGVVKIRKDGLDGYYSIDKGWIIEPKYKDATGFFNGYAIIKVNETIKQ
ncbi:WG repeat-containing protein [Butyrivibrio sp. X503]|uniref:WG repeat-containing protein n=1 Tax=Butyrivibrio sp. X503 TaxID=2364878 RepID=UPI000EA92565|nr:WG repeat-containing protein [Butyrivibrio sp. X503]RKM55120.1 WG repeat-containing protein [Butyrivibrio sp. X503]